MRKGMIFAPLFVLDFCHGQAFVFAGVKMDDKMLDFWHPVTAIHTEAIGCSSHQSGEGREVVTGTGTGHLAAR